MSQDDRVDDTRDEPADDERREALKAAAIEVFAAHGYRDAKVSDIVEQVGVAQGTFYLYYDGKQQLFEEILNDFLSLVLETIGNWEPGALDTRRALRRELTRVGRRLTDVLREHRELTSIFFRESLSSTSEFESMVRDFHEALASMLAQFNRILYERDLIESANFRMLAHMTIGMVERVVMEYVVHGDIEDVPPDEIVQHLVVHYLSGTREPMRETSPESS
jgi:AcrR family transcriptional regulator